MNMIKGNGMSQIKRDAFRVLLTSLLVLVLSLSLTTLSTANVDGGAYGKGLLFKLTAPDGRVSHILGSIHSDDPRVLAFPEQVVSTFSKAKRLALEIKMEPSVMIATMVAMVNPEGKTLKDSVGELLYQRVVAASLKLGIPEIGIRHYKPWAIATILSMPPSQSGQFMDYVLYQRAQANEVEVIGLETVEEQLGLFEDLSESEQVTLLRDVIAVFHQMPALHERLLTTYLNRDLSGLMKLNDEMGASSDKALAERFQKSLIKDRNHRMVERIEASMVDGLFIAVGALHLPGPDGILQLLDAKNYQIQRLY